LWPPARAAFSNTHDIQTHTDYSVEPHDSTGSGGDSVRDSTEHNNGSSSATTTSSSSRKRAKSSNVGGVGEALHCEQKAGDVMFVPSNWGHAILNLQVLLANVHILLGGYKIVLYLGNYVLFVNLLSEALFFLVFLFLLAIC
jgi:hypothetical protein